MANWSGFKFILQTQLGRYSPSSLSSIRIPARGKDLEADVYKPAKPGSRSRGTILFVHGMSLAGKDDVRATSACKALSGCGYVVIAPAFPEVARLEITLQTARRMEECLRWLAKNRELCPNGRLTIFTASFSAIFCLMAACRPKLAHIVRSMFLLGPPAEIASVAEAMLGREKMDMYGAFIIFKNFLELADGRPTPLTRAFSLAAKDNWHLRYDYPELNAYLAGIGPVQKKRFERIMADPVYRLDLWKKIIKKDKTGIFNIKLLAQLGQLQTEGVFLLHGQEDDVILPEESLRLQKALVQAGKNVEMLISPLISHGDHSLSIKMLPHVYKLVAFMNQFFALV